MGICTQGWAGPAELDTQGVGVVGAAGLLEDLGGNDTYSASTQTDARATATALTPGVPTSAMASAGRAMSQAQGAGEFGGYGQLRDVGGVDSYTSVNRSAAAADPPTEVVLGAAISSVQGSVDDTPEAVSAEAFFSDTDGGAADTFSATPADAACMGTRG